MHWTLEARALSRRTADGVPLLHAASARLGPDDRVGVTGESGAGKTIFLRALALLDPLTSGSICWSGAEIDGAAIPAYRARVAYVHQRPALLEGSVERNLQWPFSLGVHRGLTFTRPRAEAMLAQLGKPASFLEKGHGQLSGGEAQLVGLARVLLTDPTVLLLDEPTASLDPRSITRVEETLAAWMAAEGHAIVCVSHDAAFLDRLSSRRFRMDAGVLSEDG